MNMFENQNNQIITALMLKVASVFLFGLFSFQLKAQCTNIVNVDCMCAHKQSGVYYKDINSMFNTFEGEFVYTNNGTLFEIKLIKKEESKPPTNAFCEDMLIGGFKFVDANHNVNCIQNMSLNYANGRNNNIYATYFYTGKTRGCDECGDNEKWLIGTIKDPVSGSVDELYIRKILHNGQEAIKIFIRHSLVYRLATDPIPPPITYPVNQYFILLKQ